MHPLQRTAKGFRPLARVTPAWPTPRCTTTAHSRRHFHLSTLGGAVAWTAHGISSMHAAGLPWYISIPLVAVGVNFSVRLPIQLYTRRLVIRRSELAPLIAAWASRHAAAVSYGSGEAAQRVRRLRVATLTEKSRKRIFKAWNLQRWKSLAALLSMVPFIVVSEALRLLCGAPVGWISHYLGLVNVERLSSALSDSSHLADPSLAQGGCLWFFDLTATDPYYALPLLCSALLARSSWGRLSKQQLRALLTLDGIQAAKSPMARVQTAIGRTLLLVPLFPLFFADLPSAIFLYWAAAFGLNEINEIMLQRLVPKRTPKLQATQMTTASMPVLPYLRGENADVPTK